jgi:HD-GYP domain-containing protein (c-di-GMP phosphodiesterase class II)/DNA-binding CsgD family transcriptional regulator
MPVSWLRKAGLGVGCSFAVNFASCPNPRSNRDERHHLPVEPSTRMKKQSSAGPRPMLVTVATDAGSHQFRPVQVTLHNIPMSDRLGAAGQRPSAGGIRLVELLAALSLATDLANGFPMEKGLRNCLLAFLIGRELGLVEDELADVYYFGLLRSIGCTSYAYEEAIATGDDRNFRNSFAGLDSSQPADMMRRAFTRLGEGRGLAGRARAIRGVVAGGRNFVMGMGAANCDAGAHLAERIGVGKSVSRALTQVHERWDGKGIPGAIAGENIHLAARIGCLAHDVTVHRVDESREEVCKMVRRRAGGQHDPQVAGAFLRRSDEMLDAIEKESVWDAILELEPEPRPWLPESRIDDTARAFADFTDLKSPYTLGHSTGVAKLAEAAARKRGCSDSDVTAVRRAALMHDLGRASVSNGIWDKPGRLTTPEWERVRLHPYYTERVLEKAPALRPLARMAGGHHERLDGSGYHRGDPAALLPLLSRILAAADVYHAMLELRPHRTALNPEAAAQELAKEVTAGRLDRDAVNGVLEAAGQNAQMPKREWPAGLSVREIDVIRLAVRGRSNRQMAGELFVSDDTVKTHLRHIYEKVGFSSRAGLALFAMENDLLSS